MGKYLIILICSSLITCCKHDSPENPCKIIPYTDKDISVQESPFIYIDMTMKPTPIDINKYFSRWIYYDLETDSILGPFIRVSLTKHEAFDSCKWYFNDLHANYTDNQTSFPVSFYDLYGPNEVKVKCIIYKKKNILCFPSDDGIDTISKVFVKMYGKSVCELSLNGCFGGYFDDKPNIMDTISINLCSAPTKERPYYTICYGGFVPDSNIYTNDIHRLGQREIAFYSENPAHFNLEGIAFMKQENRIYMDYQYKKNGIVYQKKFNGYRITK